MRQKADSTRLRKIINADAVSAGQDMTIQSSKERMDMGVSLSLSSPDDEFAGDTRKLVPHKSMSGKADVK
jgi:hypothetical protein